MHAVIKIAGTNLYILCEAFFIPPGTAWATLLAVAGRTPQMDAQNVDVGLT